MIVPCVTFSGYVVQRLVEFLPKVSLAVVPVALVTGVIRVVEWSQECRNLTFPVQNWNQNVFGSI